MWDGAHRVKHFLEQLPSQDLLRKLGSDIQASDEAFLFFENVKRVTRGRAVLERHTTSKSAGFQEALDQLQRSAIVPMQFVAPVARFLFEKRLNLTHGGLSQVDDVHGCEARMQPLLRSL